MKNLVWLFLSASLQASPHQEVPLLTIADSINPGTENYFKVQVQAAQKAEAPFLILQLDTPGGLLTSTRQIIQQMLNAKIPIVVFIGPKGAHAGSAGALITLASDVAVMAPGSNMGAAHPIIPNADKVDKILNEKMANDTAAFAESLAKTKGRNADWAIKAVKKSSSISTEAALIDGIIDLVAEDVPDLLTKLSARPLKKSKGTIRALPEGPFSVYAIPMTPKQRVLSFFSDPNLSYLILSLGVLCLWIELSHPGLLIPGILGCLCLILSLISFQMLPIDYGALALLLLGMGLFVAEWYLPTFGVLGIFGLVSFVFGSLFLVDSGVPEFQLSFLVVLPTAIVMALVSAWIGVKVFRTRRMRAKSGTETLIGAYGEVREVISKKPGKIFIQGELWNAVSVGEDINKGSIVVVKEVRNMLLVVATQT